VFVMCGRRERRNEQQPRSRSRKHSSLPPGHPAAGFLHCPWHSMQCAYRGGVGTLLPLCCLDRVDHVPPLVTSRSKHTNACHHHHPESNEIPLPCLTNPTYTRARPHREHEKNNSRPAFSAAFPGPRPASHPTRRTHAHNAAATPRLHVPPPAPSPCRRHHHLQHRTRLYPPPGHRQWLPNKRWRQRQQQRQQQQHPRGHINATATAGAWPTEQRRLPRRSPRLLLPRHEQGQQEALQQIAGQFVG